MLELIDCTYTDIIESKIESAPIAFWLLAPI